MTTAPRPPFTALKPADTIALVSLSNWTDEARVTAGENEIRHAGFTPYTHPTCHTRHGRFAGTDTQRRDALHELFCNPDIKAILAVRGGYGIQRFTDTIDYSLIARHPKPFIGYSDTTTLLNDIPRRAGFPTFHGPMPTDFLGDGMNPANWTHLWHLLRGTPITPTDHPSTQERLHISQTGTATGKLWGGNLAILATNTGTPSQLDKPEILFIEDIGEDLYRFDRMLWQLARSGQFDALKAVIVGDLTDIGDNGPPAFGLTTEEVVESHFKHRQIPLVLRFPAGHAPCRTTLPVGTEITLCATPASLTLTHACLFA